MASVSGDLAGDDRDDFEVGALGSHTRRGNDEGEYVQSVPGIAVRTLASPRVLPPVSRRARALEARMKRAKLSTSESPSAPGLSFGSVAALQSLVTSSGNSRVVMPISFR